MRLWSLHPKYLDAQGLVALWREALLARAVLRGETRGYRSHPQLERFRAHASPLSVINAYLAGVHSEALARGYSFDHSKLVRAGTPTIISITDGQLSHEWQHLMQKLAARSPLMYDQWRNEKTPECHSLFRVLPGVVEPWERHAKTPVTAAAPRLER